MLKNGKNYCQEMFFIHLFRLIYTKNGNIIYIKEKAIYAMEKLNMVFPIDKEKFDTEHEVQLSSLENQLHCL